MVILFPVGLAEQFMLVMAWKPFGFTKKKCGELLGFLVTMLMMKKRKKRAHPSEMDVPSMGDKW